MARGSPIFLFFIIILIVVCFVFIVAQMNAHTPTEGIYSNNTSAANQTGQLISTGSNMALNLVVPAVFVTLALAIIGTIFLFKRR
jgi:membrane-bound ClpP family serine protease